jgi:hypothetical protein
LLPGVQEFELRASRLQCFTTRATPLPPNYFCITYFSGRVSCFCLGLVWAAILLPMASQRCSYAHRCTPHNWLIDQYGV